MFGVRGLDDSALHSETVRMVRESRVSTERLLWHLREIERRRLYLAHSAASLHSYCTKVLKLSEGSATRRVNASRLLADVPEVSEKILDGSLNISNLSKAQSFIRAEERRTGMRFSADAKVHVVNQMENVTEDEARRRLVDLMPEAPVGRDKQRPVADGKYELTLTVTEEFMHDLAEVRQLNAHKPQFSTIGDTFQALMTEHLKRQKTQSHNGPLSPNVKYGRSYISVEIKRRLYERSGSQCEHVDPNGRRCTRKHHLQIDHIVPLWAGGTNDFHNLQLLCRPHNLNKGIQSPARLYRCG